MEKGGEEGVCRQTPCESPIQVSHEGGVNTKSEPLFIVPEEWRVHLQCGPDQAGAAVQCAPQAVVLSLRGLGLQGDKSSVTHNCQYFILADLSVSAVWSDF